MRSGNGKNQCPEVDGPFVDDPDSHDPRREQGKVVSSLNVLSHITSDLNSVVFQNAGTLANEAFHAHLQRVQVYRYPALS
jgi:hypothetical protein